MSASDKKRLRKEQNAAAMTQKQQQAKKEAQKLKAYTLSFIVVMVLVVSIVLGVTLKTPITGLIDRSTTAITIGDRKINSAELSYFYVDAIQTFYGEQYDKYSSYGETYADMFIQMYTGFVPGTPVGEQTYSATSGKTWADYFIDEAKNDAKLAYALYDQAVANNFKLGADQQDTLDHFEDYMEMSAALQGFQNVNSYLRNTYGAGANLKTYKAYYEVRLIASEYATAHYDSLVYTDDDYRNYEKDKLHEFSSFSFAHHYIDVDDYLTGGKTETGEDGKTTTTYTDEEKAAAVEAAKKVAELLANADNNTVEKLNAAIAALETKPEDDSSKDDTDKDDTDKKEEETKIPEAENHKNLFYSSLETHVTDDVLEWLTDSSRTDGQITFVADKTKNSDNTETVNGYYVVLFVNRNDNKYTMGTVRHLLVKFDGGTKGDDGKTVYSEAEKAAAKAEAEALLKQFKDGEKVDEEAFTALVKEKSEDTGAKTNGGLFEDITWDSGYVESFTKWAIAEHKAGDTEIIESEYGYHIMYYVKGSELTYRDTIIKTTMANEDYEAWENDLIKDITVTDVNLKRLDRDITVSH